MGWPWPANPAWADVNPDREKAVSAHGTVMGFAFAFLFPLGAILIRTMSFRGLVVRHFYGFYLPVRDCPLSPEICCTSKLILPPFCFSNKRYHSDIYLQVRILTPKCASGYTLEYRFWLIYWRWQALDWVSISRSTLSHWFVCYNHQTFKYTQKLTQPFFSSRLVMVIPLSALLLSEPSPFNPLEALFIIICTKSTSDIPYGRPRTSGGAGSS